MIEILKYEPVSKNKVIGYVDVRLDKGGWIIRRIAHLESGEKRWFNFPTFMTEQFDGKKTFTPYIQFERQKDFFEMLTKEVDAYLKNAADPVPAFEKQDEVPF